MLEGVFGAALMTLYFTCLKLNIDLFFVGRGSLFFSKHLSSF